MKKIMISSLAVGLMFSVAVLNSGCAAFRADTRDVSMSETKHMGATFDYKDMRNLTEDIVNEVLGSPFLAKESQPPIMMFAGVQNRTESYVDTKSLTDRMRTLLFQSGKMQFVNEARREDLLKEQGYQAANATPETQVAVGKQLGAKYMLSGALTEMKETSPKQVRVSKQVLKYYKLTFEVTDLTTGLLTWTTEKEFAREASQPLIGW
jgi:penicillin-binding protein activator